jgi:hypothetical protein
MESPLTHLPLKKWHRVGLWLLVVWFVVFGAVVEKRSAFNDPRRTDADDYFRAAWSVRAHGGEDLYQVVDTRGWHYNYPPFLAITMVPLANPPPGVDNSSYLPYPVSIALWYLFSVGCLLLGIHWLASALEWASPDATVRSMPAGCRRWWALRIIPMLVCMPSVGRTLSRGQTNLIVLMLFCGMAALLIRNRRVLSGSCLAVAASIKLFPGYLALHALRRMDFRSMLGIFLGLFFCLALFPAMTLGPKRTVDVYNEMAHVLLLPAFTGKGDASRAKELLNATATDSQSFMVVMHNTLHPSRATRPDKLTKPERLVHWGLAAAFTLVTLFAVPRLRENDAISQVLFLGALIIVMLPISPVSHTHYFVFALPVVMALTAEAWERIAFPQFDRTYTWLFVAHILANFLSTLPVLWLFKDCGLSLYGTLILWAAAIIVLRRRARLSISTGSQP